MQRAELSVPVPAPVETTVRGWGGGEGASVSLLCPRDPDELRTVLREHAGRGAIARGMGRSYGDAAQLSNGLVIETTGLRAFELDPTSGTVTAQAGATIGELLHALVSEGWMVPVAPGTQHVTVGGAIASDIHGKNHGTAGTFGSHVQALGLLNSAGHLLELRPEDELFGATLGGMGLTGVILWARIELQAVGSPLLSVDTDRVADLDEALAALSADGGSHRVAWLDLLCPRPGRGVVTRAEHIDATVGRAAPKRGQATVKPRARVPARWPSGVLRPSSVRAFNELRYRASPRRGRGRLEPIGTHLFRLDALDGWPRLYGPRGFVQYQFVVPPRRADVLQTAIEQLRRSRVPCYLCVLKGLGQANGAPLSFPIEGWTITLDMPRAAPGLDAVLDRVDVLVAEAGGRAYLTKDARMRPDALAAMYPRLEEWRAVRDAADPEGLWRSDLALRTGMVTA